MGSWMSFWATFISLNIYVNSWTRRKLYSSFMATYNLARISTIYHFNNVGKRRESLRFIRFLWTTHEENTTLFYFAFFQSTIMYPRWGTCKNIYDSQEWDICQNELYEKLHLQIIVHVETHWSFFSIDL